jgi:hypothetical protein
MTDYDKEKMIKEYIELRNRLDHLKDQYKIIYNRSIVVDVMEHKEIEKDVVEQVVVLDDSRINHGFSGQNLCLECGIDMGDGNPRQLCGKSHCRGYGFDC